MNSKTKKDNLERAAFRAAEKAAGIAALFNAASEDVVFTPSAAGGIGMILEEIANELDSAREDE